MNGRDVEKHTLPFFISPDPCSCIDSNKQTSLSVHCSPKRHLLKTISTNGTHSGYITPARQRTRAHLPPNQFMAFPMTAPLFFHYLFFLLFHFFCSCFAIANQRMEQQTFFSFSIQDSPWRADAKRILVSNNDIFAAGFRPLPTNPSLFLFAIWYRNAIDQTIVWAANRDSPVSNSSSLVISPQGELILTDPTFTTSQNLWPGAFPTNSNSIELILNESGTLNFGQKWKSFDYPTNTILPTSEFPSTNLVSSKSAMDYSSGNYLLLNWTSLYLNSTLYSISNSKKRYLDIQKGPLSSLTVEGKLGRQDTNPYVASDVNLPNRLRRLTLDHDGNLRVYSLDPATGTWSIVWRAISDPCKIFGICGPNFVCRSNIHDVVTCVCPPGFRTTASGNCERKIPLSDDPAESKFLRLDFVNFTGGSNETLQKFPDFSSCERSCLQRPSCLGFVYKFDGSQFCAHQNDQLVGGQWPATQATTYLRVSTRETDVSNFTGLADVVNTMCKVRIGLPEAPDVSNPTTRNLAIVCSFFALELLGGVAFFWAFLRRHSKYRESAQALGLELLPLRRFSYADIRAATDDFSHEIGSGGFGTVYKGQLPDHRVVAVKRLKYSPRCSTDAEFWAEAAIIARVHHLNLVRLWGFCAEKGQRILVYEYVPNGSLDKYLFPAAAREQNVAETPMLDWGTRYRIAIGVARAIAYLHEECLEWVLHCDIKPENILLENDFCPKVSDFGLAKLATKEDIVSLSGIRGTRGYMAPEWIESSQPITAKADVYSFGMVLLEIVCGIRNMQFQRSSLESFECYLPKWAFEKACVEKNVEEILDPRLLQAYDDHRHFMMVDRMVKTAMWCLQERAEMRPSMGKVAKMLEGTVDIIEPPKATIFFLGESVPQSPLPG